MIYFLRSLLFTKYLLWLFLTYTLSMRSHFYLFSFIRIYLFIFLACWIFIPLLVFSLLNTYLLLTEREGCMGASWPRSPVQTKRSEVCTSDRGQDSPIQTDLARLTRCLLYVQTRRQRNKNILNNFICFPARAQAFSWLSSVTGLQSKRNKNNCSKSSFVQTSSMNEDKIFLTGLMKKLAVETTIYEKWPN